MPRRRALRFAFEVVFLVAVAAALTIADLRPVVVGGSMLLGWVVVALFERAASFREPHFGRGLPPRYYVPQVALPPPQPVDQVVSAYPEAAEREDELTWIVPPGAWGEVLEEWPVLDSAAVGEDTELAAPVPVEHGAARPTEPLDSELTSELDLSAPVEEEAAAEEGIAAGEVGPAELQAEPVAVPATSQLPEPEPPEARVPDSEAVGLEAAELEAAEPKVPAHEVSLPQLPAVPLVARHRIDPLAVPARGRFRRRGSRGEVEFVEVPASPPAARPLPGRARRTDPGVEAPSNDVLSPGA